MLSKLVTSGVVAICVLAAPAAFADHQDADYRDDSASIPPGYDYAKVVSVDPIVRHVRIETPRRECWTDTQYDQRRPYASDARQNTAGRMILGGIIGAAIGNQIGSGDGRRAATVAGAIIGSAIGHDAGARYEDRYASREYVARPVERCDVRYESSYEDRIEGYNVVYVYGGQQHATRLPYDPGDRIRVRVDVSPADY